MRTKKPPYKCKIVQSGTAIPLGQANCFDQSISNKLTGRLFPFICTRRQCKQINVLKKSAASMYVCRSLPPSNHISSWNPDPRVNGIPETYCILQRQRYMHCQPHKGHIHRRMVARSFNIYFSEGIKLQKLFLIGLSILPHSSANRLGLPIEKLVGVIL